MGNETIPDSRPIPNSPLPSPFPIPHSTALMRSRSGFNLIEIMFVLVFLGLMTGILIPRIRNMKRRAFIATMETDLRNLATDEEAYYSIFDKYSDDLTALRYTVTPGFNVVVLEATTTGWSGKATHLDTGLTCAIFFGTAAQIAPATVRTVTACQ